MWSGGSSQEILYTIVGTSYPPSICIINEVFSYVFYDGVAVHSHGDSVRRATKRKDRKKIKFFFSIFSFCCSSNQMMIWDLPDRWYMVISILLPDERFPLMQIRPPGSSIPHSDYTSYLH